MIQVMLEKLCNAKHSGSGLIFNSSKDEVIVWIICLRLDLYIIITKRNLQVSKPFGQLILSHVSPSILPGLELQEVSRLPYGLVTMRGTVPSSTITPPWNEMVRDGCN